MKSCPLCGTDAAETEACCVNPDCRRPFASAHTEEQRKYAEAITRGPERPTGTVPLIVGWVCLAAAIIALMVSLGSGPASWERELATNPYASADLIARTATGYARQWQLQMVAGGFFSLFLIFWGVGYIVRAISFLPGKEDAA